VKSERGIIPGRKRGEREATEMLLRESWKIYSRSAEDKKEREDGTGL
jgi:hypothetical protein